MNPGRRRTLVAHPFLFAVFPIAFLVANSLEPLYVHVIQGVVVQIVITAAIVCCFTLASWLALSFVLKDRMKAGLIVSLFLLLFFSYGYFFRLMQGSGLTVGATVIGPHRVLFAAWGVVFALGTYASLKTRRNLHNFTNMLNITAACLISVSLFRIGVSEFETNVGMNHNRQTPDAGKDATDSRQVAELPDIYYIILDRYASGSTLRETYHFDNSEFLDYLSGRGFYIASRSKANYGNTLTSLPSSLNMQFHDYSSKESTDSLLLYSMLEDHKVGQFLKSKGYKYVHIGSWWGPSSRNGNADISLQYSRLLPEFEMLLLSTTMLHPIIITWSCGIFDLPHTHYESAKYQFDELAKIPDMQGPTFTFVHILLPHRPYVFDRAGTFVTEEQANSRHEEENYVNQLIFANKKVEILVDRFLSGSRVPPIIVLQSDEGPYPARFATSQDFDWKELSAAERRQKFGILNAYYLPDAGKDVLYPSITPVNSFRVIFNVLFNTSFELLPDESYVECPSVPDKFLNVTDDIK